MPVITVTDPATKRAGRFLSAILFASLLLLAGLTALVWVLTGVGGLAGLVAIAGLAALSWQVPNLMRRRFPDSFPRPGA